MQERNNGMSEAPRIELPEFQCFEKVRAAKITDIQRSSIIRVGQPPLYRLILGEIGGAVEVSAGWIDVFRPTVGGHYVRHKDGRYTYEKADVFESGYRPFAPIKAEDEAEEAIDRKFEFLALNPVNGKLYNEKNAIILCAKDRAVPAALKALRDQCCLMGSNPEHIESLKLLIDRVMRYQEKRGGGKVADTVGEEIPRCLKGLGV